MRLYPALMDPPGEVLGQAIGTVGGEACGPEAEAVLRPFRYAARRPDLGLPDGAASSHIEDDGMVEIDQVVGGVGEEGMPLQGTGPLRRQIDIETNFAFTSLAAFQAASSRVSRYARTEQRLPARFSQPTGSEPSAELCLSAFALIRLASTAKPSRPT